MANYRRGRLGADLERFSLPNVHPTGRRIGIDDYCTVEELDVDGLICAGKKLHELLVAHDSSFLVQGFIKQCSLLASYRHPNIVQFIGVWYLDGSDVPVLVTEYLPYCLEDLLDGDNQLPLSMKYSILCDVAHGLVYLHARSPPIMHCDVSARSVFLTAGMRGKITNFYSARPFEPDLTFDLTVAPGTPAIMPPEALVQNPMYNESIDIFSLGCLILYTMVQDFPLPTSATRKDPERPGRLIVVSEVERRLEQMKKLYQMLGGKTHPLAQLVTQCLHNDPWQRPSARDVLSQLQELKSQVQDPYGDLSKLELIQALHQAQPQATGAPADELRKLEERATLSEAQVQQLQSQLRDTTARISVAEEDKQRAEQRASIAEQQALVAERRASQAEQRAAQAEERLRTIPAREEDMQFTPH